jgi:hypothetical protein
MEQEGPGSIRIGLSSRGQQRVFFTPRYIVVLLNLVFWFLVIQEEAAIPSTLGLLGWLHVCCVTESMNKV